MLDNKPQLIKDLKNKINAARSAYTESHYNYTLETEIFRIMAEMARMVQAEKARTYRSSWKKRGWAVSVFGNIARKFDRLESIFTDHNKLTQFIATVTPDNSTESVLDTLVDLGVYSLLAATKIMMEKPEIFDNWISRNGFIDIDEKTTQTEEETTNG